ncbi:MAG TPA: 3-dehydroquinate synthase [Bacillota bacterium]|nr:3-dehydroquinate synthase [Bacillota bacterium]
MIIHSLFKDYEVSIEKDIHFLNDLCSKSNAEYVIDKNIYEIYKDRFIAIPEDRLIVLEATEENKIIESAMKICGKMTEIPEKRNALLISIGGGIIQDITGFVANILYRGIQWIFVPTTLLASCDSCIGGKSSLNYQKYKNLIGTFYPPDSIHICPQFFQTLTERDYKSGLGEVVKFNLMAGVDGLHVLNANIDLLLKREPAVVSEFVNSSLLFKKDYIEKDEFDKGERIKLNFAHTFGHAIEVLTEYEIPHGTAVAIGMIIANHISVRRGILNASFAEESQKILLKVIDIDIHALEKPLDVIVQAIRKDKKQTSRNLTAVLMTDTPKELVIIHDLEEDEINEAFSYFVNLYKETKR